MNEINKKSIFYLEKGREIIQAVSFKTAQLHWVLHRKLEDAIPEKVWGKNTKTVRKVFTFIKSALKEKNVWRKKIFYLKNGARIGSNMYEGMARRIWKRWKLKLWVWAGNVDTRLRKAVVDKVG